MTGIILLLGFLFGLTLQYAGLNRYNTISGMATLDDLTVAKAIAIAVGVGAILINVEIALGLASYHVKPLIVGGILIGGILFGAGMAILGYCPGTMAISLGEGSTDALIGIIGGLLGGLVYTLILPNIKGILGPDWGTLSFNSEVTNKGIFLFMVFALAAIFIASAFWMNNKEQGKNYKWLYAGIALAVLNVIVFAHAVTDRVIGASTTYPYLADLIFGQTHNDYFSKIEQPGHWEMLFLSGAFLAGLTGSLVRGNFRIRLVHQNWEKYKGVSRQKRAVWAFIGGFILILGARMAGGCTSGHILSGGMQLAFSSLLFAAVVFASLLLTGKLFYKK